MGYMVTGMDARRAVWTRSAVVAVALTWVFVLVGTECGSWQFQPHPPHPRRPIATSVGAEFVVSVNHAHVSSNSTQPCPEQLASAVVPRSTISSIASVAVATVVGIAGLLTYLVASAGRGPPATVVSASAGQELLARLRLSCR
jgi:lipoprotein LpqS